MVKEMGLIWLFLFQLAGGILLVFGVDHLKNRMNSLWTQFIYSHITLKNFKKGGWYIKVLKLVIPPPPNENISTINDK